MDNQVPVPIVISDEEAQLLAKTIVKNGPATAIQSQVFLEWANDARLRQRTLDGLLTGEIEVVGWTGIYPQFKVVKNKGEQDE